MLSARAMARLLLTDAVLLDPEGAAPERGALLLDGERIAARFAPSARLPEDAEPVSLAGLALAPGFIDLHYHGRLIFAEPSAVAAELARASEQLLASGVTAFLPTTVAWPQAQLLARVGAWAAACAAPQPGAAALGLHLEGPWIRREAAGAQPSAGIRDFDLREGNALLDRAEGRVRMLTLAPELPSALALLDLLGARGVVAALGHSHASEAETRAGIDAGARHVTHLFNAMGPLHQRAPGLAGIALTDDRVSCDLICDGVHVHPALLKLAARAKSGRWMLISDRVELPAQGLEADFGAGEVRDDGSALRLPDGTLAGSRLCLDLALRNAETFMDCSQLEAIAAVSLRPARLLGIEAERGTLRPGGRADLTLLNRQGRVVETWVGGRRQYRVT